MKKLVILGLSAGAIFLLYNAWKKQQDAEKKTETKPLVEEKPVVEEPAIVCPDGQIICETNTKKCFDPKIRYIVNPCKA
jgi:hypothetical protein